MIEMSREKAIRVFKTWIERDEKMKYADRLENIEIYKIAIEALSDNKPSRTWIAKNEYRRGWHDAITRALLEVLKIHVGNEIFDMVQKETLIGLGLSMDSALGAEPYSETEESYPEPDRPHGEWIKEWKEVPITGGIWYQPYWSCPRCGRKWEAYSAQFITFCSKCGMKLIDGDCKEGEAE